MIEQYEAGVTVGTTRASTKVWASVVIAGLLVLAFLAVIGNTKSDGARRAATAAEANTRIAQESSVRTECIRGIAAELDHARWALVGQAFNATSREDAHRIGALLNGLPLITDLANQGGALLDERVDKCPPPPTIKETP